jgi:methionyl-tRNA synthetase
VAWPYANGPLHLGHMAGCYLPPDIFARYHRLKGNKVLMVSGSDMHGTPITVTAQQEGKTPEEVAMHYHSINSKSIEDMGISFDLFSHTHTKEHFESARWILDTLDKAGYIEPRVSEEPYDPVAEQFLPDRYVEGTCPHCNYESARGDQCDDCGKTLDAKELKNPRPKLNPDAKLEFRETEHLFFKLSAFRDSLLEWLSEGKEHWRPSVINFTRNWLEEGLIDRAITRDLEWGIDIPRKGYEKKRMYVWFEAVMGYYSASLHWAKNQGKPDLWKEWWENDSAEHYYFMAKDNIPFHTIIWPAMLSGCGLHLPHDVPANEYLLLDSTQFSKSRRHAVWMPDYLDRYDSELLRYYLASIMPEQKDANFTWEDYVTRINNELIGNYGNLMHRIISFAQKNYPDGLSSKESTIPSLNDKILEIHSRVSEALEACKFKRALQAIMELSQTGNIELNEAAPWKQLKADREACEATLVTFLNLCRSLSVMMTPFLPKSSQKAWEYLNQEGKIDDNGWDSALEYKTEFKLQQPLPLFSKLNMQEILEKEMPPEETNELANVKPEITFDDFKKLDIRIGTVEKVEAHPNADKLWLLDINLGGPTRRIVTGLRGIYESDDLIGKKIAVLVNLAPAKFRGEESNGMLLAAEGEGIVSLLQPDKEIEDGSEVH